MPEPKYFKLKDNVGVDGDGNLEPLHEIGLEVNVPTMVDEEVIDQPQGYSVQQHDELGDLAARILPGTRIVESADYRVNAALLQADFEQIDKLSKAQAAKEAKDLTAAVENAARFNDDGTEREPRPDAAVSMPDESTSDGAQPDNDQPDEGE